MKSFIVVICLVASPLALGQFHHQQAPAPIKESRHLHALQQPHLPKDTNVLAETERFLHRFAQLKAQADAAPDPPQKGHRQASHNQHSRTHHQAPAHHQQASHQPAPHFQQNLHHQPSHHQPAHHQPAHHQQTHRAQAHHAPVHQAPAHHQPAHHAPAHHQQAHHAPAHHQPAHHQPAHHQQQSHHNNNHQGPILVPVMNQHGIIINPNRYPGPLAHHVPAAVHG